MAKETAATTVRNRKKERTSNEEKKEGDVVSEKETTEESTTAKSKKPNRYKTRKEMPSVAYLLAHGDPETAHLPKTWCDILGFPIIVAIVFGISLLVFHHAPHHLSTHEGFRLPQNRRVYHHAPPQEMHKPEPIVESISEVGESNADEQE